MRCPICKCDMMIVVLDEMWYYPLGKKVDFRMERKQIELECGHVFVGEWCEEVQDMKEVGLVYMGEASSVEVGDLVWCDLRELGGGKELSENSE